MMTINDFKQKQILFVFLEQEEKISFKNDNIIIKDKEGSTKHQSTCYRLFALFVVGHVCLTSGLLERSQRFGFTIILMSYSMRVYAILPARAEGNVLLRKIQYEYDNLEIGANIVSNKIHNQCANLKKIRHKGEDLKKTIAFMEVYEKQCLVPELNLQEIMGLEGSAARDYFSCLFINHNWQGRKPRVKHDMANCLLDIGYTMLFHVINGLLEMYGFDTYNGVLHRQFYHRKSLVCDFQEPFRPIVDACVLKMLNLGQCREKDFYIKQNQYFLYGKQSIPYIELLQKAILEYKNEIYYYIQAYYRFFVRKKSIENMPFFDLEKKDVISKL